MSTADSTAHPTSSESALEGLRSGDFALAERQALGLVAGAPNDPRALYARGLTILIRGDAADSIPWFEKALSEDRGNATYLCNLGVAYLRSGKAEDAIAYLARALKQKPAYYEAGYNLTCAQLDASRLDEAQASLEVLARANPNDAKVACLCGDLAQRRGQSKEAARHYRRATELDSKATRAWTNLAEVLAYSNHLFEATECFRTAITLDPTRATVHQHLGDCLFRQEAIEEAMDAYANAFAIDSESPALCAAIGKIWLETGDSVEASTWFAKAIEIDADCIEAHCGLANIIRESGEAHLAVEVLEPLLDSHPEDAHVLISLADAWWEEGEAQTALELLRRAQAVRPGQVALLAKTGQILSSSGNVADALGHYEDALSRHPACIPALCGLATTQRADLAPERAERMETLLNDARIRAGGRAALHNGLAYYYDGRGDYESAAGQMTQANENQWESRQKRGWEYEPQKHEAYFDRIIASFDHEYFDRARPLGHESEAPVFIVGMPRSGTTLTEQILSRHPDVLGIGERNFAMESFNRFRQEAGITDTNVIPELGSLDRVSIAEASSRYLDRLEAVKMRADHGTARHIVDKMPDNYSLLGWILTLFPNAKIIHCRRDPRDVALSCWMTQFGALRWASQIETLVSRIQQYQRLMGNWRDVLPSRFLELDYESVVSDQEGESRRLVDFLGLDWDPACLSFYESDRLVRTASITQVRKPIYDKSVAKWRRYEPYLRDLFDPLSPTHERKDSRSDPLVA